MLHSTFALSNDGCLVNKVSSVSLVFLFCFISLSVFVQLYCSIVRTISLFQ